MSTKQNARAKRAAFASVSSSHATPLLVAQTQIEREAESVGVGKWGVGVSNWNKQVRRSFENPGDADKISTTSVRTFRRANTHPVWS